MSSRPFTGCLCLALLINSHPILRVVIFGVSTLIVSLPYVHGHHWVNHQLADFTSDHGHLFRTNLIARAVLTMLFCIIVRWAANVSSLGGWILCGLGTAVLAYPTLLAWTILSGANPHIVSVETQVMVPYLLLIVGFSANMVMAVIYGALGWLIMARRTEGIFVKRPHSDRPN